MGFVDFGDLDEAWHRLGDRPPASVVVGIGAEPSVVEVPSSSEELEGEAKVERAPVEGRVGIRRAAFLLM